MAAKRESAPSLGRTNMVPATTPEERENQLVSLASDLAERQMREGTASAQVIVHYLKLGSSREKLEQQRIGFENDLSQAKKKLMESQRDNETLFQDALAAMRGYAGIEPPQSEPEYEDYVD